MAWVPPRYDVPLVADIHFQPAVALMVADAFEKIRINPGNFADGRKTFEVINYDDPAQFRAEQEHIAEVGARPQGWMKHVYVPVHMCFLSSEPVAEVPATVLADVLRMSRCCRQCCMFIWALGVCSRMHNCPSNICSGIDGSISLEVLHEDDL